MYNLSFDRNVCLSTELITCEKKWTKTNNKHKCVITKRNDETFLQWMHLFLSLSDLWQVLRHRSDTKITTKCSVGNIMRRIYLVLTKFIVRLLTATSDNKKKSKLLTILATGNSLELELFWRKAWKMTKKFHWSSHLFWLLALKKKHLY